MLRTDANETYDTDAPLMMTYAHSRTALISYHIFIYTHIYTDCTYDVRGRQAGRRPDGLALSLEGGGVPRTNRGPIDYLWFRSQITCYRNYLLAVVANV